MFSLFFIFNSRYSRRHDEDDAWTGPWLLRWYCVWFLKFRTAYLTYWGTVVTRKNVPSRLNLPCGGKKRLCFERVTLRFVNLEPLQRHRRVSDLSEA